MVEDVAVAVREIQVVPVLIGQNERIGSATGGGPSDDSDVATVDIGTVRTTVGGVDVDRARVRILGYELQGGPTVPDVLTDLAFAAVEVLVRVYACVRD